MAQGHPFWGGISEFNYRRWWKSLDGRSAHHKASAYRHRESAYIRTLRGIRMQCPSDRSPHMLGVTATVLGTVADQPRKVPNSLQFVFIYLFIYLPEQVSTSLVYQ
jgi:hypothetical protein